MVVPVDDSQDVSVSTKEVGLVTNNVECEVAGIALALQNIAEQFAGKATSESHRRVNQVKVVQCPFRNIFVP